MILQEPLLVMMAKPVGAALEPEPSKNVTVSQIAVDTKKETHEAAVSLHIIHDSALVTHCLLVFRRIVPDLARLQYHRLDDWPFVLCAIDASNCIRQQAELEGALPSLQSFALLSSEVHR